MTASSVCGWALERRRGEVARECCGLDEVGRGPMFGAVVAAAVIFREGCRLPGLTDSKQLTEKQRNEFDAAIRDCAVASAIAAVDVETIDRINIRRASLLAMRLAVEQLAAGPDSRGPNYLMPDFLLIDGRDTIEWPCAQQAVVGGDGRSVRLPRRACWRKCIATDAGGTGMRFYPGYGLARIRATARRNIWKRCGGLGRLRCTVKSYWPVAQRICLIERISTPLSPSHRSPRS